MMRWQLETRGPDGARSPSVAFFKAGLALRVPSTEVPPAVPFNETSGMVSTVIDHVGSFKGSYVLGGVALLFALLLRRLASPPMDANEPPLLMPKVPIIGHILGIIKWQNDYYYRLYNEAPKAIATLPMLGGKTYVIWDPAMIQATFRQSRAQLDVYPIAAKFAKSTLSPEPDAYKILLKEGIVAETMELLHGGMHGEDIRRMNEQALHFIAKLLNGLCPPEGLEVDNLFLWLRRQVTVATTRGLYGVHNPFEKDAELTEALWGWDESFHLFVLDLMPNLIAPEACKARGKLQRAMMAYYGAGHDKHETTARMIKDRADALRRYGMRPDKVGQVELAMTHVSTSNTIPTLYWFVSFIFSDPGLVARLRDELSQALSVDPASSVATVSMAAIDERCPLLVGCWRETVRMSNRVVLNRQVMTDTWVSDSQGRSYLLKGGEFLQMSGSLTHRLHGVWGEDWGEFDPERFMAGKSRKGTFQEEKAKRSAYVPFGGGRHLCPGRNFAFAESLGLVAALIMGFELRDLHDRSKEIKLLEMALPRVMEAPAKPVGMGAEQGAWIRRREGWEKVTWKFEVKGAMSDQVAGGRRT